MPQINVLYNRTYERFSGSAVRPTYSMLSPDDMQCYGWGAGQELEGYVRAVPGEQGELQCLEACGDPEQALAVLADLMAQGGFDGLSFFTLHHDHPLLRRVRRGAVQVEQRFFERSGWQIKLINLPAALAALRPALEARLERSQFAGWQGGLLLDAGGERALLAIDRSRVAVSEADAAEHAIIAGPAIGRLLIGSDDPLEVLDQARAETSGLGAALAQALFPNLHPVLAHWDEF